MHRLMWERLEELLQEASASAADSEIQAHLEVCPACRRKLESFRRQADLLRTLRWAEPMSPSSGFYNRVMERIEARRSASVWSALMDPVFGWRLVWGSLAALLVLGAFLIVSESSRPAPLSAPPEAVIAVDEHPADLGTDPQHDRETVLVNLATYRE